MVSLNVNKVIAVVSYLIWILYFKPTCLSNVNNLVQYFHITIWTPMHTCYTLYNFSCFIDFDAERTALVSKCYPALRSLCRQRGYEFQVCDLRWGMYDTIIDDHSFSNLCLQQLKSCQTMSTSVNFVVSLFKQMSIMKIIIISHCNTAGQLEQPPSSIVCSIRRPQSC